MMALNPQIGLQFIMFNKFSLLALSLLVQPAAS